jgi:hypothetical protein
LADNLRYGEPASGQIVATELVSGAHVQIIKLDLGRDGQSTPLTGTTLLGLPTEIRAIATDTVTASGETLATKWAAIAATTAGDATIVAGIPGRRIRVLALTLACNKNIILLFKSGNTTVKINSFFLAQGIPLDVNRMSSGYFVETDPGDAFVINLSTNALLGGSITYIEA